MDITNYRSMDFLSYSLTNDIVYNFDVIDDYNKESLAVKPGLSCPGSQVTHIYNQLDEEIGLAKGICVRRNTMRILLSL